MEEEEKKEDEDEEEEEKEAKPMKQSHLSTNVQLSISFVPRYSNEARHLAIINQAKEWTN